MDNVITQAQIVAVKDDNNWRYTIDADIPAFGTKTFRFLTWRKAQGDPPEVGDSVMGEFEAYRRSNYYIKQGALTEGDIDGTEEKWQLEWNFVGVLSSEGPNGNAVGQSTASPRTAPLRATSSAAGIPPAVFMDANMAVRVREGGINDRKAWSDAKEHGTVTGENGVSEVVDTLDETLDKAERIADWYNTRLEERLGGNICTLPNVVQAAQDAGATLVSVEPEEPSIEDLIGAPAVPVIRNRSALGKWVSGKGWSKEQVQEVLDRHGYKSSADYLKEEYKSAQGLAELLLEGIEE